MGLPSAVTPNDVEARLWRLPPGVTVSLPVCRRIGLASIIDGFCPMRHNKHVSHGEVAEFLVLHLLQVSHRKPLYRLEDWAKRFSVGQIYDCAPQAFNDDRVGRTLDALAESIVDIEAAAVRAALERYDVDVRAIHWDLTHVTFTGAYEDFEAVEGGYGGGRLHERQVKVSLHATSEGGLPVHHQIVSGGAHQAPFAPAMLEELQKRLRRSDLIIVSDRAGISYDNIQTYRSKGAHCLGPLQAPPDEQAELLAVPQEAFHDLQYRSPGAPDKPYRYYETTLKITRQKRAEPLPVRTLFIYSTLKAEQDAKERQKQVDKAIRRFEQIRGYLNQSPYYKKAKNARTQLDKAAPQPVRPFFSYTLSGEDGALSLNYQCDEAALTEAAKTDGRYILIADLPPDQYSPDDIFVLFKRQVIIEHRFRNVKSELHIHPFWLHNEPRIRALLLLYILALLVYTLIELSSERAGLTTPRYHKMTARELLLNFEVVDLIQISIKGYPTQWKLHLSDGQTRLLRSLGLPMPRCYIRRL